MRSESVRVTEAKYWLWYGSVILSPHILQVASAHPSAIASDTHRRGPVARATLS